MAEQATGEVLFTASRDITEGEMLRVYFEPDGDVLAVYDEAGQRVDIPPDAYR